MLLAFISDRVLLVVALTSAVVSLGIGLVAYIAERERRILESTEFCDPLESQPEEAFLTGHFTVGPPTVAHSRPRLRMPRRAAGVAWTKSRGI